MTAAPQSAAAVCPECGTAKRPSALFCARCGRYFPDLSSPEIFRQMGRRLRRAALWNIFLAIAAYFVAPPAGLLFILGVAFWEQNAGNYFAGAVMVLGGLVILTLPVTYFFFIYDRLAKVRCAACNAVLQMEMAERGRFCYVCGTRYQPGRRGIHLHAEMLPAAEACGFCAMAVEADDRFCSACGCMVAGRKVGQALAKPAGNTCPICGEKFLNRRLAIFTLRMPQAIYCPFCGGLLKSPPEGERHGQKQDSSDVGGI